MKIKIPAIASLCAIAFSMPVMANPHPIASGYQVAVQRRLINPRSPYAQKLLGAVNLIQQGTTTEEASRKTGISLQVLNKLIQMGTPIPYVEVALPVPNPPVTASRSKSKDLKVATLPPPPVVGQAAKSKDKVVKKPPKKNSNSKSAKAKTQHVSAAASAVTAVTFLEPPVSDPGDFVVGWGLNSIESPVFQKLKIKNKPGLIQAQNIQTLWLTITESPYAAQTTPAKTLLYSPLRSQLGMQFQAPDDERKR